MTTLLDRKDRMSMASGLEVRVPFCDHHLVEYVWNIPWSMKAMNGRRKQVLRDAAEGLLPEDVRTRPKSPYPKTHNPLYEELVRARLAAILDDPAAPLHALVNARALREGLLTSAGDYGRPLVRAAHGRSPDAGLPGAAQRLDGAVPSDGLSRPPPTEKL